MTIPDSHGCDWCKASLLTCYKTYSCAEDPTKPVTNQLWFCSQRCMEHYQLAEKEKRMNVRRTTELMLVKLDNDTLYHHYADWNPKLKGDVGRDLVIAKDVVIAPYTDCDVGHGISVSMPVGCWGQIVCRSSAWAKHGLMVVPGVIDNGYVGPLFTFAINFNNKEVRLKKGSSISQLVLHPVIVGKACLVNELPETERGERGWGSTDENTKTQTSGESK